MSLLKWRNLAWLSLQLSLAHPFLAAYFCSWSSTIYVYRWDLSIGRMLAEEMLKHSPKSKVMQYQLGSIGAHQRPAALHILSWKFPYPRYTTTGCTLHTVSLLDTSIQVTHSNLQSASRWYLFPWEDLLFSHFYLPHATNLPTESY